MVSGMADLKNDAIDYAFFCCDGVYNMDAAEAGECAKLVNAKHSIPYHVIPPEGVYFSREKAEAFESDTRMILEAGEEIELES
jgi:L-ascorbate metabolism protein UlaG (beta-lactamase superfamily)